jgi:hypothetical protein
MISENHSKEKSPSDENFETTGPGTTCSTTASSNEDVKLERSHSTTSTQTIRQGHMKQKASFTMQGNKVADQTKELSCLI